MSTGTGSPTEQHSPTILEQYRNYAPPAKVRGTVETLLAYVPPKHLRGLEEIILTNVSALPRRQRRRKGNSGGLPADCLGQYYASNKHYQAKIIIYVDNVLGALGNWFWKIPFFRHTSIAEVLYHEIGHHVHAITSVDQTRLTTGVKEAFAERYQSQMWGVLGRAKYWYLYRIRWVLGIVVWVIEKYLNSKKRP